MMLLRIEKFHACGPNSLYCRFACACDVVVRGASLSSNFADGVDARTKQDDGRQEVRDGCLYLMLGVDSLPTRSLLGCAS